MGIWDNQLPKWMEILKQQANPKKSTNFTYNPNWNVLDPNQSTLVNPNDFGTPWSRGNINQNTNRRSITGGIDRNRTREIEDSMYYRANTDEMFDKNGNLTEHGLKWAIEEDKINKGADRALILLYDENGNIQKDQFGRPMLNPRHDFSKSKNMYNVQGDNFTTANYIKDQRTDNIPSSHHNILLYDKVFHFKLDNDGNYIPIHAPENFNEKTTSPNFQQGYDETDPVSHFPSNLPLRYKAYIWNEDGTQSNINEIPNGFWRDVINPGDIYGFDKNDDKPDLSNLKLPFEEDNSPASQLGDRLANMSDSEYEEFQKRSKSDVPGDKYRKPWWQRIFGKKDRNNKDSNDENNNKIDNRGWMNPYLFDAMRLGLDNTFNILNTEKLIKGLRPNLTNYTPSYRQIYGDYIAQQQAQREAGRLINRSPLTSNAQIQSAVDLEAIDRGNRIIEQGNYKDAQMYWNTSEKAFLQGKENNLGWQNAANANYKSITDLNNQIAQLRYEMNRANQQNTDQFAASVSERIWDDFNYEKAKQRRNQEMLEQYNDSSYGIGADRLLLQELSKKYDDLALKTGDDAVRDRTILRMQMNTLEGKVQAQEMLNRLRRLDPNNGISQWEQIYGERYKIDSTGKIVGIKDAYKKKLIDLGFNLNLLSQTLGFSLNSDGITTNPQSEIIRRRNGGILKFLQQGGFVKYTPTSGLAKNPYLSGGSSSEKKSSSSSSESQSSDEKTKDKLLNNIAETLKGIDGLDSDVSILTHELSEFFDIQRYSSYSLNQDPTQFYSTYIRALQRVNQVKQSAKQFDNAYKLLEKNEAFSSPAVTNGGDVIVGVAGTTSIKPIKASEYLNNKDKYHLVTNGELLELRRTKRSMAFSDDYVTMAAQNGTSLQAIEKYVKEFISQLGNDQESRDTLTRQFGKDTVEGLQTLQRMIAGGLTNQETAQIAMSLGALGEYTVSVTSQERQIKNALDSILAFMPNNMKTLLTIYSDGPENAERALVGLITKGTSSKIDFKIGGFTGLDENGKLKSGSSSKSGSGSGSGGNDKETQKDQTLVAIIRGIGGTPDRIRLNEGTKSEMSIDGKNYQINGAYEAKSLASALSQSKIMGISDPRRIYFGDQLLSSEVLSDVAYLGNGFTRVMLPITYDGSPDFTILSRFEAVCNRLRQKGINPIKAMSEDGTDEEKRKYAEELQLEGLYGLVNQSNGLPNISRFGLFLLTEGLTSSRAGIKNSDYVIQDDNRRNKLESILEVVNSSTGKTVHKYETDNYNMFNPLDWFSNYEKIYEGTIYIPINSNELQADIASGNKVTDATATSEESEAQRGQLISNFKDRQN